MKKFYELSGSKLNKNRLLNLEMIVAKQLCFNFNLIDPEHFINRYLHILDYHTIPKIYKNAIEIFTLHYKDETMLKYPISKIAAVSVILAINIYKVKELVIIQDSENKASDDH